MNDLISRQAVNGIIDALFQNRNNTLIASPRVWYAFKEIQNLPSANNWIPCSSGNLPEENEPVLGTFKFQGGNACLTTERIVVNGEERWSAACGMTPIAWQQLPEPYKEGEE